jgi:hypothetical protein
MVPHMNLGTDRAPGPSTVLPGAWVAISQSVPGYVCVEPAKGGPHGSRGFGWLPADRVQIIQAERPLNWWRGTWRSTAARIKITIEDNRLSAEGHAIWQGQSSPHFGEFSAEAIPDAGGILFKEGDDADVCQVKLVAMGNAMVAEDNNNCGGFNVSFTGFYTRHTPSRHR